MKKPKKKKKRQTNDDDVRRVGMYAHAHARTSNKKTHRRRSTTKPPTKGQSKMTHAVVESAPRAHNIPSFAITGQDKVPVGRKRNLRGKAGIVMTREAGWRNDRNTHSTAHGVHRREVEKEK